MPKAGGHRPVATGKPGADVGEERLQAARRVGVREETDWIAIFGRAAGATNDMGKIRGEIRIAGDALKNILPWRAKVEDGPDRHWFTPAVKSASTGHRGI